MINEHNQHPDLGFGYHSLIKGTGLLGEVADFRASKG